MKEKEASALWDEVQKASKYIAGLRHKAIKGTELKKQLDELYNKCHDSYEAYRIEAHEGVYGNFPMYYDQVIALVAEATELNR